jgi:hypothetical protein
MDDLEKQENAVTNSGALDISGIVEQAREDALKRPTKAVTVEHRPGLPFIRIVTSRGCRYRQVCRHIHRDGKRVIEIARLSWPSGVKVVKKDEKNKKAPAP